MRSHHLLILGLALAAVPLAALSAEPSAHAAKRLTEIPDPELNLMRGRYTVGDNAVAWFGVSMISTWQTQSGQTLQSTMTLGMDFTKNTPVVTFQPTVSVTAADAPMPVADTASRSVDGAGLANVSGVVQSVQVAGDHNAASNIAQLNVRNGDAPASSGQSSAAQQVTASSGNATATASYDGNAASVLLQVEGQGAVQQWIRNGSLGQTVQLTSDHQQVNNRLDIDLVRQTLASNAQLNQNVAQAIGLTRGIGVGR